MCSNDKNLFEVIFLEETCLMNSRETEKEEEKEVEEGTLLISI